MTVVNTAKSKILDAFFGSGTFKIMLLDNNHTTDIDAQEFIDDVSANEVSGTGYTAGGATLANVAVTTDDTDDEGVVDADDAVWSTATITARYGVIYKDTGTPGTSPIVNIIDFGEDKVASGVDFTVQFGAEGIFNLN